MGGNMTDTQTNQITDGVKKIASGGFKSMVIAGYTGACINATPKLVGLIAVSYPRTFDILGEGCIFQFVVLAESLGASFIYWVNWKNLGDWMVNAVKDFYTFRKRLRDAAQSE